MKPFSYSTDGHYKNSSKGKGFPRHIWKRTISLDEDTAVSYGYAGNRYVGNAVKMGMNKSYGNLAEYTSNNYPYPKHSHVVKWLRHHIGQNVDKVYSEFKQAWDLQPALKDCHRSVSYWFDNYVWRENGKHFKARYYEEKRFFQFIVDSQNRLQLNPDYNYGSWKKKPIYDKMFVRDNRPILDSIQTRLNDQHGGFWLHGGDAVGPIGIKQQLWVVHPKTGMPVKASVSLIRSAIFEKKEEKKFSYWSPAGDVALQRKLSEDKLTYLREEFVPVDVIWDTFCAKRKISVECPKSPFSMSTDRKDWTYVVSKSSI